MTDRSVTDPLLAVDGLTVGYGSVLALRDVSLEVAAGEIVAALGPNGAGKTTLLRTLAGALKPRSGSVRFDGSSIVGMGPESVVRRGIALIPEGRHVFPKLTVQENLTIGGITRSDREEIPEHRAAVADHIAGLPGERNRRARLGCQRHGFPALLRGSHTMTSPSPSVPGKRLDSAHVPRSRSRNPASM